MKSVPLLLLALGCFLFISETHGRQHSPNSLEEWKRDLLQADKKYKCPHSFGVYSDPDDCEHYYICIAGSAFRKKCSRFLAFDIFTRRCVPKFLITCDDSKDETTTSDPDTKVTKTTTATTTTDGGNFVCTSFMGDFPHPDDCSKYYSCLLYRPTAKTCPRKKLFDAVKNKCEPEDEVHCGTRKRPDDLTTKEISDATTTEISLTPTVEKETPVETDATTTEVITTTTEIQQTPPDHDCKKDDLDCIIDKEGDEWFKCPDDVGLYPHPSSDKLFIFCMNWVPSIKKCGLNLVFSKVLLTCTKTFL